MLSPCLLPALETFLLPGLHPQTSTLFHLFYLGDLIQCSDFKYHLYAGNSQICIASSSSVYPNCLPEPPLRHLGLNRARPELLTSPTSAQTPLLPHQSKWLRRPSGCPNLNPWAHSSCHPTSNLLANTVGSTSKYHMSSSEHSVLSRTLMAPMAQATVIRQLDVLCTCPPPVPSLALCSAPHGSQGSPFPRAARSCPLSRRE